MSQYCVHASSSWNQAAYRFEASTRTPIAGFSPASRLTIATPDAIDNIREILPVQEGPVTTPGFIALWSIGKTGLRPFFGHQLRCRHLRGPGKRRDFCRLSRATVQAAQARQVARTFL